jgi:hypothetical protein
MIAHSPVAGPEPQIARLGALQPMSDWIPDIAQIGGSARVP